MEMTYYKAAFVVPDLARTVHRFNALHRYDWREVPATPQDYRIGDSVRTLTTRAVITAERPHIHLLEEIPGTPWTRSANGAAFHVAYWVDDIRDAVGKAFSAGFVIECSDPTDSGVPRSWAYLVDPEGVRIELLDRRLTAPNDDIDPDAFIQLLPRFESTQR